MLLLLLLLAVVAFKNAIATREPTATLDVISYNDVYELLQDEVEGVKLGGPSRVIPLVQKLRQEHPNTLVLFAGDTMSPSLWSFQFQGMQMVDAHNAIGVDFASLGNHEFDFGIDAFLNVSSASKFPWLNANCYEEATGSLLRGTIPHAIKEFKTSKGSKPFRVGVFGVMYDMKLTGKGLYWSDPIEAAKQQVKILRENITVDFVIALTHQNVSEDNRFSKEVKGVDVIYGGHEHTAMLQTTYGTPYLKADFDFRSIWQSHIVYYEPQHNLSATSRMTHQVLPITEDLPSDPALDHVIANYAATIGEIHNRTIGSLCAPLDLTNKVVRASDAPVGALFADAALRNYGNDSADLALINGGVIRSDKIYPAGSFTLGQLIAWSPFGNTVVVIETDGASIKAFLTSQMVASCGDSFLNLNGFYMHPAGIKYTFQCSGSTKGTITTIEWFNHPTRSGSLQDSEAVKLATTNYVLSTQFAVQPGVNFKTIVDEAEAIRIDMAIEKLLQQQPNQSFCYSAEGRSQVLV